MRFYTRFATKRMRELRFKEPFPQVVVVKNRLVNEHAEDIELSNDQSNDAIIVSVTDSWLYLISLKTPIECITYRKFESETDEKQRLDVVAI